MLVIGEKLNSSIPKTLEAFQKRNSDAVIRADKKAGAFRRKLSGY